MAGRKRRERCLSEPALNLQHGEWPMEQRVRVLRELNLHPEEWPIEKDVIELISRRTLNLQQRLRITDGKRRVWILSER